MNRKPITDAQYIKKRGRCPFCKSDITEGVTRVEYDVTSKRAFIEWECFTCYAIWDEVFMITGYIFRRFDQEEKQYRAKIEKERKRQNKLYGRADD